MKVIQQPLDNRIGDCQITNAEEKQLKQQSSMKTYPNIKSMSESLRRVTADNMINVNIKKSSPL